MNVIYLTFFLLAFISACSRPVAEVNGEYIKKKDYLIELEEKKLSAGSMVDELTLKNIVIDSLIEERLILSEAKNRNIKASAEEVENRLRAFRSSFRTEEEFKKYMEALNINESFLRKRFEEKIIIDKFIISMADLFSVPIDDVKKAYEEQRPLKKPERVRVAMIETGSEAKALEIFKEIRKIGFENAIKELKEHKDLIITEPKWVDILIFPPDMQDELKKSSPDNLIGPFEKKGSWYIMKLYEKKPPEYKTFEEAKTEIMFSLLHQKRLAKLQEWLKEKKAASKIIIYAERL